MGQRSENPWKICAVTKHDGFRFALPILRMSTLVTHLLSGEAIVGAAQPSA
jgi:hypothetical protein